MRAAYRLQLGPHLDFAGARALVPYLRDLGVTDLYLSPALQARSGSTHGYDVVDPRRVSEELGGEQELRALCREGLDVILDVVPNHMATSDENPFWRDRRQRAHFFDLDEASGRHRRFFDIDELGGVRVEDDAAFAQTHGLVLELVREGLVSGLRVDHVDGLADPAGYLARLREAGVPRIWVEKILEPGETLRAWPVDGTTGYEFLGDAQALLVDPRGERVLTDLHAELAGDRRAFGEVASEAKLEQARTAFQPETERLERELGSSALGLDLGEALASLPVYRTYVEPWSGRVEEADRAAIEESGIPEQLARILLLAERGHDAFVTRFQQTTGAIMAKGVEDTALYRYNRLLALNEVGGDPGRFSLDPDGFHARNEARRRFPLGLLTTQTHDTKRSGDVRARIGALAAIPAEWRASVLRWRQLNAPLRSGPGPDANEEHLLYQTLVGAWPLELDRLLAYAEKALREAKTNTSWVDRDERWEQSVREFCIRLYEHEAFVAELTAFVGSVERAGERSSLAQLLLKLTSPGVPDIYQGDELWCYSLVDPDNRRPVDFDTRRAALAELRAGATPTRETRKLFLVLKALEVRARLPEAFLGAYTALPAGSDACAYMRGDSVVVAVALRDGSAGARLAVPARAAGAWRNELTGKPVALGEHIPLDDLLEGSPVALLTRA